jgi:WS/DGAT/MGAT family acyltransferase
MDTLFWRMSADPRLRVEVLWAWFLDRTPDWEDFLAGCDWMTRALPRLRHRVVDPLWRMGVPVWAPDGDFRLSRHVHRVHLPAPGSKRDLLDLVEWRASTPLDRGHPLWEATLVEGLSDGRAVIVLKWHHAVTDALGVQMAMRRLLPQAPETAVRRIVEFQGPSRRNTPHPVEDRADLAPVARTPMHGIGTAMVSLAGEAMRAAAVPRDAARELGRLGRNVLQVAAPVMPSPLLRKRSLEIHCGLVSVPLADLKTAGKSAGVSVTAAYVAGILGAFHKYHAHYGLYLKRIPVMLPVSIREPFQTGGGNYVAAVRIPGSVDDVSPAERMQLTHTSIARARSELAAGLYPLMSGVSPWMPLSVMTKSVPVLSRGVDIVITSVPGLSRNSYVAGARIVDAVPWAPRGPAAANITTASHGDLCGIGTNLDPAAITDTKLFHRLLQQSFEDVLTTSGSS